MSKSGIDGRLASEDDAKAGVAAFRVADGCSFGRSLLILASISSPHLEEDFPLSRMVRSVQSEIEVRKKYVRLKA
jgi:hypothetical protein